MNAQNISEIINSRNNSQSKIVKIHAKCNNYTCGNKMHNDDFDNINEKISEICQVCNKFMCGFCISKDKICVLCVSQNKIVLECDNCKHKIRYHICWDCNKILRNCYIICYKNERKWQGAYYRAHCEKCRKIYDI